MRRIDGYLVTILLAQRMDCCFQATKGSAVARKTRTWKSLKQIVAAERSLQWTADTALCELLDHSVF